MKELPRTKKLEVAQYYILGHSYSDVEGEAGVSHGSVVNIIKELEDGKLGIPGSSFDQISDISFLSSLTNLMWLDLSGNQIDDISPLVENHGLGSGDMLWLKDNNLDLKEGSEDMENIKALEDKGVSVQLHDEPIR